MSISKRLTPIITVLLFSSSFIFQSCLTGAKVDKWISEEYSTPAKKTKPSDFMTVALADTNRIDGTSFTIRDKSKVLPLLLYWRLQGSLTSTLNSSIPFGYFNQTISSYANSKGLKQKLNGQTLEIAVTHLPKSFTYGEIDHIIVAVVYAFSWSSIYIEPQTEELTVSYRVLKDNVETKKGTVAVKDLNEKLYLKMFHAPGKKFMWKYLDQYNTNLQTMSKQVIDKLMSEL